MRPGPLTNDSHARFKAGNGLPLFRLTLLLVGLALGAASYGREDTTLAPITIDATALTQQRLWLINVSVFDSTSAQNFQLQPGTYALWQYDLGFNVGSFTLNADGSISFDPSLSGIFSLNSPSTLIVRGKPITLDATALTNQRLWIPGIVEFASTPAQNLKLLPGTYGLTQYDLGFNVGSFTLNADGSISFDPSLSGVFSSNGPNTLIVKGYPITIDGTPLPEENLWVPGIDVWDSLTTVPQYSLLPGTYSVLQYASGATIGTFTVKSNDTIDYDPTYNGLFGGRGTNVLTINRLGAVGQSCSSGSSCATGYCPSGTCASWPVFVGRWGLNDGSGQSAAETTTKSPNGTWSSSTPNDHPTWSNGSLIVNANQYVRVHSATALETAQMSFDLWLKSIDSSQTGGYVLTYGQAGVSAGEAWAFQGGSNGLTLFVSGPVGRLSTTAPWSLVSDGKWHRVVGSFDGIAVDLFVDAVNVATNAAASAFSIQDGPSGTNDLFINTNFGTASSGFTGYLSDVRVYAGPTVPSTTEDSGTLSVPGSYRVTQPVGCGLDATASQSGDMTNQLQNPPLLHPFGLKIHNLFWSGNWDAQVPAELSQQSINNATKEMIDSGYFFKECQYQVPHVTWEGSNDSSGAFHVCPSNPPSYLPDPTIYDFVTCEESMNYTNIVKGIPSPSCSDCGITGPASRCYEDIKCFGTPNLTGDTIINVFLPPGVQVGASNNCANFKAYHFQLPSNNLGSGFAGGLFGLPATAGRPIYVVIIPLSCSPPGATTPTLAGLMKNVSHEDSEAATDPFPGSAWYNLALGPAAGEAADLCNPQMTTYAPLCPDPQNPGSCTSCPNSTITVEQYWSNDGHHCVAMDLPQPASCAGAQCGTIGNGCGGTLNCGTCPSGQGCNAQAQCVSMTQCTDACQSTYDACVGALPTSVCLQDLNACLRHCHGQ